ncbi:hypothetical protein VB690_16785 [Nodularia spumigena CH309]|nr:hypothetical protein [Nodularia spumigena CH309]
MLGFAGCGDDDTGGDGQPNTTSEAVADDSSSSANEAGAPDDIDALEQLIATSDAHDEVNTQSGGRVVVAVICEAQTGGTIVSVGSVGVSEGVYEGDFEPAAGGSLTLQVLADGQGIGARQTTLDAPNYAITFPEIDGGIEFTLPGCTT